MIGVLVCVRNGNYTVGRVTPFAKETRLEYYPRLSCLSFVQQSSQEGKPPNTCYGTEPFLDSHMGGREGSILIFIEFSASVTRV